MTEKRPRHLDLSDNDARLLLRKHTRRGFLTAGVATAAGVGAYSWLRSRPQENMTPWPQRRVLAVNEHLAHAYLSPDHLAPTYSIADIGPLKPNGDIGLDDDVEKGTLGA